jgi:hypothetical protein
MGDDLEDKVEKLMDDLATQRDELRVQMHLFAADAKNEWEELEEKWQHLQGKMGVVGKTAKASAQEIGAASEQLGEELGRAYKRLKMALKQ